MIQCHDLSELVSQASMYENILKVKYQRKNLSWASYYTDPNIEIYSVKIEDQEIKDIISKIGVVEVMATNSYIYEALVRSIKNQGIP